MISNGFQWFEQQIRDFLSQYFRKVLPSRSCEASIDSIRQKKLINVCVEYAK